MNVHTTFKQIVQASQAGDVSRANAYTTAAHMQRGGRGRVTTKTKAMDGRGRVITKTKAMDGRGDVTAHVCMHAHVLLIVDKHERALSYPPLAKTMG